MAMGMSAILFSGCEIDSVDSNKDPDQGGNNPPPQVGGGGKEVKTVGGEESCGALDGERPSIALDTLGQPHISAQSQDSKRLNLYHRINGVWQAVTIAEGKQGGEVRASRLMMSRIEIDAANRAWVSCKLGTKEYGDMLGQGLWMYNSVESAPAKAFFKFLGDKETSSGNGSVALDPAEPGLAVVLSRDGIWIKVDTTGAIVQRGGVNVGESGEKIKFDIVSRSGALGVWHVATVGYSQMASSYQNTVRQAAGLESVPWAGFKAYPEMGSDFYHPGVGVDRANSEVCYLSARFNPGLVINIWDGTQMLYPPQALPVVDSAAVFDERFAPQWTAANGGGAFLLWSHAGMVRIRHVAATGVMGPDYDIGPGVQPAAETDPSGNIHLVYNNGGLKYRLITTQ